MKNSIKQAQLKWSLGNMQVFSYGNSKLPKETLIVNITSAQNCPSDKLGLCNCSKVCYAKKCERIYKNYLNKNLMVESYMCLWSDSELKELLEVYIKESPIKIKYIRLNEAGDFPHQESVDRWNILSKYFYDNYKIKTYCYTCRNDLDFSNVNFQVNGSRLDIKSNRHFICIDKKSLSLMPAHTIVCKGNCHICKLCYDSNYKGIIYCQQH